VSENKINILHLQTELNLACGITKTINQIIKYSSTECKHHLIALGGDGLERFNSSTGNIEIFSEDRNTLFGTFRILKFIYKFVKLNSIEIHYAGNNDMNTKCYLFTETGGQIAHSFVELSQVTGSNIVSVPK